MVGGNPGLCRHPRQPGVEPLRPLFGRLDHVSLDVVPQLRGCVGAHYRTDRNRQEECGHERGGQLQPVALSHAIQNGNAHACKLIKDRLY